MGSIIEEAINWALTIADDDRHWYSQSARNGPNYDCSSFVSYAYINAGVSNLQVSTTGTMLANFKAAGFIAIPFTGQTPNAGDVLFFDRGGNGHAIMYTGNKGTDGKNMVHASGSSAGILQANYYVPPNTKWDYILRWPASYGALNETPSAWNSGRNASTYTPNSTMPADPVNSVEYVQTGTDAWGNPIGYSYTTGYNFTPYIATVGPNAKKVDYPALINAKVSGMMFCAGWLYNDYYQSHIPRKEYINPHLDSQIKACQEAELPYALYAIVRAKNRIEADAECKKLYYIISKYPPKLGLWLYLDMHNSPPSKNEEILDCYYNNIVNWGLSAKCGLYLDKSRMHQIDWTKYQYKFYLWLEDHITDQHTLDTINDEVLKSSFFEVE